MYKTIIDSFCSCYKPKQIPFQINIIESNPNSDKANEKSNIFIKSKKFPSTKSSAKVLGVPNQLNVTNDIDSINKPYSGTLTLLKLPEELIRKKIKMFGTGNSSKRRIVDENRYFQNFQNKIDDIVNEYNKQKTISESDDSETN